MIRPYYRTNVVSIATGLCARILVWGTSDAPEYIFITVAAVPGPGVCTFRVPVAAPVAQPVGQHQSLLLGIIGTLRRIRMTAAGRSHVASLGVNADSIIDTVRSLSVAQARADYGTEYESFPAWFGWSSRRDGISMLSAWPPTRRGRS